MGADPRELKGERDLENKEPGISKDNESSERREWEPMRLTFTGDAKDVVQQGGGKLSTPAADPGEPRKQQPTG
jgi:hypothetical protein